MTDQSHIERIVMQRVHLIRALRIAVSSGTLSMLVSLLALWGIGSQVWVAQVLQNAPTNPYELIHFYTAAFLNTSLAVQVLIAIVIGALLWVAREVSRALAYLSAKESF